MGEFPRKSDGRRVFTVEFKRGVVQQLLKGEKTLAEVSRELDIQPSVVRQWKRRFEAGATAAVATNEDVVPVSALREAHQRIRELERLLGKKQMEIEILQAAQEVVKKVRGCAKGPDGDPASGGDHLPDPAYGTADGVLRRPHPAGGLLPAARRRDGAPADPRRHQQPGHLRLSPGVGDGEPDVSCELQPQAHSAAHADAWPTRRAATRLENESDAGANANVHCRIARHSMRGRPAAYALKSVPP